MTTIVDTKKLKTLADIKRALHVGARMTCTFHLNAARIGWKREVVSVNTVGVRLIDPTDATSKPSHLDFPKASLMEIEGNKFRIFEPGYRDLTDEEKACLAGQPRDEKQEEYDLLTDCNVMFFRRKQYFEASSFPYLRGCGSGNGMLFNGEQVRDPQIKGKLTLEYELEG